MMNRQAGDAGDIAPTGTPRFIAELIVTGAVAIAIAMALAYEAAFTVSLWDGRSSVDEDGGNRFATGILLLLSIPALAVVSLTACFWLRHRFGFWRALVFACLPSLAWALILIVRFRTGDCGNSLSRC